MWPVRTDNNFIHVGTPAAAALPTRRAGSHRGLRADPIAQRAQRVEDDGDVDRLLKEGAVDRSAVEALIQIKAVPAPNAVLSKRVATHLDRAVRPRS
jgi:hypothetical protein